MDKDNNPAPDNNDSGNKGQEDKPTTFTQEQVNDIVSKRLAENTKAEKKLKDEVSKALAESERQSKLSEAEREKEFKAKQQKELEDRERTITLRERRADTKDALSDRNIDTDLVDFVIDIDEDKTNANIDKLEKAFNKAVEAGVKAKLAGTSPEDYGEGTKPKTSYKVGEVIEFQLYMEPSSGLEPGPHPYRGHHRPSDDDNRKTDVFSS